MQTEAAVSRRGALAPTIEPVELGPPQEGELLVRVVACGVCHTDLSVHAERGPWPYVLGHEGAGVVEQAGPGVTGIAPGDHVVMSASAHCGVCSACRAGLPPYCLEGVARNFGGARPDGTSAVSQGGAPVHGHFFGQSSFARYAIAAASSAVPVPRDLPLALLAPLGCGVMTGAGSVLGPLRVGEGTTIAVFGTGSVGLGAVMAAHVAGAERIVAVDVIASRLELALELGATDAVNAVAGDPVEAVRDVTGGGADVTFTTVRAPAVYDQAVKALAVRGTMAFVAPAVQPWAPDLAEIMHAGRSVTGIVQGGVPATEIIPRLIGLHREERFPFHRLIREYAFADIGAAFADAEAGTTIKPVLRME